MRKTLFKNSRKSFIDSPYFSITNCTLYSLVFANIGNANE